MTLQNPQSGGPAPYTSIRTAYMAVVKNVYNQPSYSTSPRGEATRELLNYSFSVAAPTNIPLVTADPERDKVMDSYACREMELYRRGGNRVEDYGKLSKFWNRLANPDGTINSAYGHLIWSNKSHGFPTFEARGFQTPVASDFMRTPWQWALQSLIMDRDSRQAFVRFSLPQHQWIGCKDQVCTMHMQFMIRNNQLYSTVVMRSNDIVKGLAYDIRFFASLHQCMIEDLRQGAKNPMTGEHISYGDIGPGFYTHIAHSMHMYESDKEVVEKMLGIRKE